ncbi:hypothetical protein EVAR_48361_1 [Eumeta japonica]|uniref:Uncharacterized protein n=1 Tax=Eumeta variegata TaxID=151549 RepID=A0A4C1WIM2_EUMVA|nr:hypothetical protein EVAR_48361_1 [Eumeta japonica]
MTTHERVFDQVSSPIDDEVVGRTRVNTEDECEAFIIRVRVPRARGPAGPAAPPRAQCQWRHPPQRSALARKSFPERVAKLTAARPDDLSMKFGDRERSKHAFVTSSGVVGGRGRVWSRSFVNGYTNEWFESETLHAGQVLVFTSVVTGGMKKSATDGLTCPPGALMLNLT